MTRRRLDAELVRRGLAANSAEARAALAAGHVLVAGLPAPSGATLVSPGEPVTVVGASDAHVSRGGDKLLAAIERFGVEPSGLDCLDAGASTGGFTDRLLRAGARRVVAVDVAYGQLDWALRNDPRVTVLERTNVRDLRPDLLPFAPDLVVADLSFISLRVAIPVVSRIARPEAQYLLLVKPQFEAARREVEPGGVVRRPSVWWRVLLEVADNLEENGIASLGVMPSPVIGPAGNVEFFIHGRGDTSAERLDPSAAIAEAEAIAS